MNRKFSSILFALFLLLSPCAPSFADSQSEGAPGKKPAKAQRKPSVAPQKSVADEKKLAMESQMKQIPVLLEEIKGLKAKQGEQEEKIRKLEGIKGLQAKQEEHDKKIQELADTTDVAQTEIDSIDKRLDSNLRINGYFDLKYSHLSGFQDGSKSSFDQSHTALFFQLPSNKWLFFAELEWEHSGREMKQERAWVKYGDAPDLEVKMGHFLTPTYWNLNHYPTVATAISIPDISRKILPWDLTGLSFKKALQLNPTRIDLQLYAGNGFDENPKLPGQDVNNKKAIGVKLNWENNKTSQPLTFGLNFYHDNRNKDLRLTPVIGIGNYNAYLLESSYRKQKFEIHVSYGASQLKDASRPNGKIETTGWYAEPSFRVSRLTTLYLRYEDLEAEKGFLTPLDRNKKIVGVNYRPFYNTVAKLEALSESYHETGKRTETEINMAVAIGF